MPHTERFACLWLAAMLATHIVVGDRQGLDCSFPVHNKTLQCGDMLGDRQAVYEKYMAGCHEMYSKKYCDENEDTRIGMNVRQPPSMVNYTESGYHKIRAPPALIEMLTTFWEKNKGKEELEYWNEANIYTNHWESPTYMLPLEDKSLPGGGDALQKAVWDAARNGIEGWTDMELRPTSLYGIRVYKEGSILSPHVDRVPLVSSAIVNVAQDVDEDWPLEIYDRAGNAVNITMEVGDMVFYESHSIVHGRPFALKGSYYANTFIHFEPIESKEASGDHNRLPPYIVPGSIEAKHWLEDNTNHWSSEFSEQDLLQVLGHASDGNTAQITRMIGLDPKVVNVTDDNGWQPIHEATRAGHTELVQLLLDHGADMNSRTSSDARGGQSVLNVAKTSVGVDHPVYLKLQTLGALDIEEDGDDDDANVGNDDDDEEEERMDDL